MVQQFDGSPFDTDPFGDPDRCVQVEDDGPEGLSGTAVVFDESADDSDDDDDGAGYPWLD